MANFDDLQGAVAQFGANNKVIFDDTGMPSIMVAVPKAKQEKEDIKAMEDELCLLTYAVLACLKGLKEQGCNGPVTEAIGKIEKHINQKAHGQET